MFSQTYSNCESDAAYLGFAIFCLTTKSELETDNDPSKFSAIFEQSTSRRAKAIKIECGMKGERGGAFLRTIIRGSRRPLSISVFLLALHASSTSAAT